jgi:hypothetical protein
MGDINALQDLAPQGDKATMPPMQDPNAPKPAGGAPGGNLTMLMELAKKGVAMLKKHVKELGPREIVSGVMNMIMSYASQAGRELNPQELEMIEGKLTELAGIEGGMEGPAPSPEGAMPPMPAQPQF